MTNGSSQSSVLRRHVGLFGRASMIFEWLGEADSEAMALDCARSSYALALEAVLKTQGLRIERAPEDFRERAFSHFAPTEQTCLDCWRIPFETLFLVEEMPGAGPNFLSGVLMAELLQDAAMSDVACFEAVISNAPVSVGISVAQCGSSANLEIDAFALFGENQAMRRQPFGNSLLRDATRIIVLRSLELGGVAPDPVTGESSIAFPLSLNNSQSATLRAAMRARGPQAPKKVAEWLCNDGFPELATKLATCLP